MFKMSTKSTYALRALIHMARSANSGPENLHRISKIQNISLPYLEQIFSKLKKSGLVKAIRGPQGGFELTKKPTDINLAEIVAALEGPFKPVLCSFPERNSENCREVEGCVSRSVCFELDGALLQVLTTKTLGKLCEEAERLHSSQVK